MSNHSNKDATLNEERVILKEKKILAEEKGILRRMNVTARLMAALVLAAAIGSGAYVYWQYASHRVSIENSEIKAPSTDLAPQAAGILEEKYVQVGDSVQADEPLVRVGNELVKAKAAGLVIAMNGDVGKLFNRGEVAVTMISPGDLRVVGRLAEDKGLREVQVGQVATFTVDAFGSRKYTGVVDEISPTSRDASAVFAISDKRAEKEFDVKVRFNVAAYPELKNGMSAKLTVIK
jgi:multidrug resistance efflux pump